MLTHDQNEALTHVGPGTPMGNLMRRYWVPTLLSWELPSPDCPPVEVRLLGEDLVAFRQTDGIAAVVSAFCAHRRVSLFWGRNEENGLRCVYHGWKFDKEGRCVDMPSEPEVSNFRDRVRIPAYPTHEVGGVIWCYMGPLEKQPALPLFEFTQAPPTHRAMSKVLEECNWLQTLEGGIDTVHANFLHRGRPPGQRYNESNAQERALNISLSALIEVVPTDYGYTYAGIRDMREEGNHVRAYHWVMPWTQLRASGMTKTVAGHMWVPVDDRSTMIYNWHYSYEEQPPERPATSEEGEVPIWFRDANLHIGAGNEFGVDVDPSDGFRSIANRRNKYMIDREDQRLRTYTGIRGVNTQDRAVQESMGAIADRTLERLGTTDRAIIAARRELLKAIEIVQAGGDPPGVSPTFYRVRPIERILPKDSNWLETLGPLIYQTEGPLARVSGPR